MGKGVGVCTCGTAGSRTLEGYFFKFSSIYNELANVVMDTWCIKHNRPVAAFLVALFFLLDHRGSGVMSNISNDGDIGFQCFSNHMCTVQTHFFLHRIGNVKAKRQLVSVFLKKARHFRNHKTSNSVIQSTAHEIAVIQFKELIGVGNHTAYKNSQLLNLLLSSSTT